MQANGTTLMTKKTNLPAIFFLVAGSISAFITAFLLISGRYITIGLIKDKDIPIAGYEVWGLEQLFALFTLCLFVCAVIYLLWPRKFGESITWWQALLGFTSLIFTLITFFPPPFEFQLRHNNKPSDYTYIFLTPNSSDGVDGNDDAFMGSLQKDSLQVYFDEKEDAFENKQYVCVGQSAWWWGNLTVSHDFMPSLESVTNQKLLLEQYCKPITSEEAAKRGLRI